MSASGLYSASLRAKNSLNFKDLFVEIWYGMCCLRFVIY